MATTKNPAAKLASDLKRRQARELRELGKRLKAAIVAVKRSRGAYLAPAVDALRRLLAERKNLAARHARERAELKAERVSAKGALKAQAATWPATRSRRIGAAKAFASGAIGAKVAAAERRHAETVDWLTEARTAARKRKASSEVRQWGKRKSPKAIAAAQRKALHQGKPAEFRERAEDAARSFVASHFPRMLGAWAGWVKAHKPFSERARLAWLETARPGHAGADYWGEKVAEQFTHENTESAWGYVDDLSDDEYSRMAYADHYDRSPSRVPDDWADFPLDEAS